LGHGVGGSGVPVGIVAAFIRLQNVDTAGKRTVEVPGAAPSDMIVEAVGTVLSQDQHVEDIGIDTIAEGEIDNAVLSGKGYSGFGAFRGQHSQACAFTASQNHSLDFQVVIPLCSISF